MQTDSETFDDASSSSSSSSSGAAAPAGSLDAEASIAAELAAAADVPLPASPANESGNESEAMEDVADDMSSVVKKIIFTPAGGDLV